MTLDKSLRIKAGSNSQRNVLTRAERVERLKTLERWDADSKAVGMPKVRVEKLSMKKKKKVKEEAAETPKKK